MTVHTPPPEGGRIVDEPMSEALSRRYLAYALSTITNRALPDVRDGFKPVHRRIMYAMHQMRLNPQAAARKCAKVVGEVFRDQNFGLLTIGWGDDRPTVLAEIRDVNGTVRLEQAIRTGDLTVGG